MRLTAWSLVAFCVTAGAVSGQAQVSAVDVGGKTVALYKPGSTRAVVLLFIASDCPISNRELPEMKRVQQRYAKHGVEFWFVYPNVTESTAAIRAHLAAFTVGDDALIDPHGQLAGRAGVRSTPEAAVLVPSGNELRRVYAGRIDDRYVRIGEERPQASRHDLEDAVAAVLAGQTPKPPGGPAVGCGIVSSR
jgi:hypothetical protein